MILNTKRKEDNGRRPGRHGAAAQRSRARLEARGPTAAPHARLGCRVSSFPSRSLCSALCARSHSELPFTITYLPSLAGEGHVLSDLSPSLPSADLEIRGAKETKGTDATLFQGTARPAP